MSACEYHAYTTGQQCGRTGHEQFAGLALCGPHIKTLERDVIGEVHRNPFLQQAVRRELHQIDDWQDEDLRKPEPFADATVYFVKRFQFVKIGYAVDVRKRIKDINAGSSIIPGMVCVPVKLLASIPGGREKEKKLHERFAHIRVGGEWFLWTSELMRFVYAIEAALWPFHRRSRHRRTLHALHAGTRFAGVLLDGSKST